MSRVPITVMGYRCDRCGHEWVPRELVAEPRVCPKCKNPYWNKPRKPMVSYEDFQAAIRKTLQDAEAPLTWTEIRTAAKLPQLFPNNQWVRRLERDIGLERQRDDHGIIHWRIKREA
ncbi:MAG: hypothetical protein NTV05_03815 [Acidobacteria bacterium]|nr:hypothetical protein [Acidobacteriota bacterium]